MKQFYKLIIFGALCACSFLVSAQTKFQGLRITPLSVKPSVTGDDIEIQGRLCMSDVHTSQPIRNIQFEVTSKVLLLDTDDYKKETGRQIEIVWKEIFNLKSDAGGCIQWISPSKKVGKTAWAGFSVVNLTTGEKYSAQRILLFDSLFPFDVDPEDYFR